MPLLGYIKNNKKVTNSYYLDIIGTPITYQDFMQLTPAQQENGNWYVTGMSPMVNAYSIMYKNGLSIGQALDAGISDMTGATSSVDGTHGLVPAPQAGDEDKVLRGDGTWGSAGDTATVRYNENTDRFEVLKSGVWVESIKAYADNYILFDGTSFYATYDNGVYTWSTSYTLAGGFAINLPNFIATACTSDVSNRTFIFSDAINMTQYSSLVCETSTGAFIVDLTNINQNAYIGIVTMKYNSSNQQIQIGVYSTKTNDLNNYKLGYTQTSNGGNDINIYKIYLTK